MEFQDVLGNFQLLLTMAGGDVRAEPFASSVARYINHYNCASYSDQRNVSCPSHCQVVREGGWDALVVREGSSEALVVREGGVQALEC